MINIKKLDEKDFVFINRPVTKKEDEAFSEFLKNRKSKTKSLLKARTKEKQKTS